MSTDTLYYSIKGKEKEVYDSLQGAISYDPDFIIIMRSKGFAKTKFPERTVEDEHFHIYYSDPAGNPLDFNTNGWKLSAINDPIRYSCVISFKIVDPTSKVRIFDENNSSCHFSNSFRNNIQDLILLYYFFKWVSKFQDWLIAEQEIFNYSHGHCPTEFGNVTLYPDKLSNY